MIAAIIQARTGSSRLPAKVLKPLGDATVLRRVVDRVRAAPAIDEVVLAIPDTTDDDALAAHAATLGARVVRGSESDVLDRYFSAAQAVGATRVVRITSDCPLMDPNILDAMVRSFAEADADYMANTLPPRRLPRGLDAEIFTMEALTRAHREATAAHEREHVTPYIYEHPERFAIAGFDAGIDAPEHRWTLDTPEDYALISRIWELLDSPETARTRDILALFDKHPDLFGINADIRQKSIHAP